MTPVRALLLSLVLALAAGQAAAQDTRFFRIATGAAAGTYFPIGAIIASAISAAPDAPLTCDADTACGVPGLIAVAQSTRGSVENIALLQSGAAESAFAQSDVSYWAFHATGLFRDQEPVRSLRAIAGLYPETVQIAVRRDSDIHTLAGLRGKRVSVGPRGSGTLVDARILLEYFGLGIDDYASFYLQPGQAADQVLDGRLDAFFIIAGFPSEAILQLARTTPLRLLPIRYEDVEAMNRNHPFFIPDLIPADAYPGIRSTPAVSVGAQWLVSEDVDEETVYRITRALFHPATQRLLRLGHADGARINLDSALHGLSVPLHDGAQRFYREQGLLR